MMTGTELSIAELGGGRVKDTEWLYQGWFMPGQVDTFWIVEGACTTGDRAGSHATFGHCLTLERAHEQRAALQAGTEGERYDRWVIIRHEPALAISIEDGDNG